jgi:hypothetical protein
MWLYINIFFVITKQSDFKTMAGLGALPLVASLANHAGGSHLSVSFLLLPLILGI